MFVDNTLDQLLELRANFLEEFKDEVDLMLTEAENDEETLDWHFHDSFANESSSKEDGERHEEVTAKEASQIKERVRDWGQE